MSIQITPKQDEAVQAIKGGYRYILTGGAVSTAKTYGVALIILSMAAQYPKTRYAVSRLNLTTIKRTTLQTFREVAESMGIKGIYKENLADLVWEFGNGSQVWFVELDHTKDRDFNKLKGLELTAGAIDECNEVLEEGFDVFSSRVGRQNSNGEPQFIILTCNPADNWVKQRFYTPHVNGTLKKPYIFIPSLPSDNPYNSSQYLEALEGMPHTFRKRYVYGDWDYQDDDKSLFKNRHLDASHVTTYEKGTMYAALDVALEGTDRAVASLWSGNTLVDINIIKDKDEQITTSMLAGKFKSYCINNDVGYQHAAVDSVGNGKGVYDFLHENLDFFVDGYKAGSSTKASYDNIRTEHAHQMAMDVEKGITKLYDGCPHLGELKKELVLLEAEEDYKQIKLEPKKKLKERIGKSPDIADAVIMAYSFLSDPPPDIDSLVRI